MGSKEAERKKRKTKLHIPVDDESTNRERNREEDGFCEAEMRAKGCVQEREGVDGANTCERATPRALDQLLVMSVEKPIETRRVAITFPSP